MEFDPTTHPHRRYNPLTREHVLVSPHRTKRPWQGQVEPPETVEVPEYDPSCYLCPRNTRSGGQQNEDYTHTWIFENDFPALLPSPGPQPPASSHPLLTISPVDGACDVLIFHPRHDLTLARMPIPDVERVIDAWTAIYQKRGSQTGIQYVQIFENKGAIMGCSNPHPHGQVWSLSQIPTIPSKELESLLTYALAPQPSSDAPKDLHGRPSLLLEYGHFETTVPQDESRIVIQNNDWLALVPWWAVWPFEILVLPYKCQIPSLLELTASEKMSLAEILSDVTKCYDNLFSTSFPYSMGIHQRPIPKYGDTPDAHDVAQLHFHFNPPLLRSAAIKKFVVGFELMGEPQRDLTPESAAQRLRNCVGRHYLEKSS